MTRNEALAVATSKFNAFQTARTNHDYGRGPAVDEASFGYHHGWVSVAGFSFGSDEMVGPNNQPYLD